MRIEVASRLDHIREYYFSKKLREIAQLRAQGHDIINLGIGSPDLAPHPSVIKRVSAALTEDGFHTYQSYKGIPEIREALARWYVDHFDVDLDPDQEILPLIGSKEGIMHLSMTYLEEGDQILVPDPGYPSYRSAALLAGATVHTYALREELGWFPDLAVLEALDLSRVKMMWLNYPHMPTGAKASLQQMEQLVYFARRHQILLCHDNPYAFILNDEPLSILQVLGAKEVAVELTSLSKTFNMAGWRVGFLTGHGDRITEVLRFKSNMDSGMFRPVQLAATEALQLEASWYDKINADYRQRRVAAEELMQLLGCTYDAQQVGMFLWGKVPPAQGDGYQLSDEVLAQARVFVTPGGIFGENGKEYVRISLCNNVNVFQEAIRRCALHQQKVKVNPA